MSLHVVTPAGPGDRAWEVDGDPGRITVGAVAAAVGLPPTSGPLVIDGRAVAPTTAWAEAAAARGARLQAGAPMAATVLGPPPSAWLRHVAGLGAGTALALPKGRHVLGPALAGPPGVHTGLVASTAATIDTTAGDQWVEVAGAVFRVDTSSPAATRRRPPDERGLVVVHRPPRAPVAAPIAAPVAPPGPEAPRPPAPLSWVTLLGPLPVVVVMALVLSPRFALLGLAGPVLAFGRWGEGRVRHRRERRRHTAEITTAKAEHAAALRVAAELERERRWAAQPAPDALAAAAAAAAAPVWERRPGHDDALHLAVGATTQLWPTDRPLEGARLGPVPCVIPLAERHAIGVVGPAPGAQAVARWLVAQAAVLHGPADLSIGAAVEPSDDDGWHWLKWLPHLNDRTGLRRVATTIDDVGTLAGALVDELQPGGPARRPAGADRPHGHGLIVVTSPALARARVLREQLVRHGGALRAVVVAATVDELPAWCDVVVEVDDDGTAARVTDAGVALGPVTPTGVDRTWAEGVGRALGRLDDPEHAAGGTGVPTQVGLTEMLGLDTVLDDVDELAARLQRRWDAGGGLRVPIGAGEQGPFELDLVHDGPHALVAGTTGAGKSELLRTWVAAMAASASPDDLNLILIDFKGGGAFDACAALPHTVAVVTDLDAHLAARALRCLRAEVRHRETLLRRVGASDLAQYVATAPTEPLARLVVIVDEFATLAAELPEFVSSVVDVAQRGRSLGIHLVLATQRPSGVVDSKVRANTNLRVALRVQDDADSLDVLGGTDAARLSRRTPGRALARLGSGDVTLFQAAFVSTATAPPADDATVSARPFTLWEREAGPAHGVASDGPTDLERLAGAARLAARQRGCRPPRTPWPAPLPDRIDAPDVWAASGAEPWSVPLALADEPDLQRQTTRRWRAAEGNVLFYGANGLDTSRALMTVVLGLAAGHAVDDAHAYVIDGGSGALAPLVDLPHCGGYASGVDTARAARLVEVVADELDRRRALARHHRLNGIDADTLVDGERLPLVMVAIENAGAVVDALEADGERSALTHLAAIVRDGAALGVVVALTVPHERALPGRLTGLVPQRYVLRMAETTSYLALGLAPRELPALRGLRAVVAPDGTEVQLAEVTDVGGVVNTIAGRAGAVLRPPAAVRTLGERVALTEVAPTTGRVADDHWSLPVAVTPSYRPARLELPAGIHAVVTGGPGAGRSTTLVTIAHAALAASGGDVRLVIVTPRRSPLALIEGGVHPVASVDELEAALRAIGDDPHLVLVDDAELVAAPLGQALARLADTPDDRRRIVAAGRPDAMRSTTAWTAALRHGRTGVALQPATGDGDVFRTALPLRLPLPAAPGRGYVIALGTAQAAQVAVTRPAGTPTP